MPRPSPSYRGYRFPPEIISHAVWLYHRFCLSARAVEDRLAQRGVTVSYKPSATGVRRSVSTTHDSCAAAEAG